MAEDAYTYVQPSGSGGPTPKSLLPTASARVGHRANRIAALVTGGEGTNALCESTIGLFKTEAINDGGPAWADRRAVEWQVARWVHWYNHQRLHSSIGDIPALEFEHAHRRLTP